MTFGQLAGPACECPARHLSHFQAKIPQTGTHAVLDRRQLVDKELPGIENGAHLLAIERFDVYGFKPSKSEQLSDAARIVAICFDHHRRECSPDMTAFHDRHAEAFLRQPCIQPFGKLTGFEPNMLDLAARCRTKRAMLQGSLAALPSLTMTRAHR